MYRANWVRDAHCFILVALVLVRIPNYRRPALCRVPGGLPSVVFWALGKDAFAECFFFDTRQSGSLPSVFFNTRQRGSLPSVFFDTRQRKFQSIFWSSKLIQMKKFLTTKLYNSSRCTMFVLVFSSYDKVKVNLFTNLTYLSCSLWNYKRDIRFVNNVRTTMSDEQMIKQPK